MDAPHVGDKVKYLGTRVTLPEGLIENPTRIDRVGVVVHGHDGAGNVIESPPGMWPVHVEWDNGDPTQTCFRDEVEKLENSVPEFEDDVESA